MEVKEEKQHGYGHRWHQTEGNQPPQPGQSCIVAACLPPGFLKFAGMLTQASQCQLGAGEEQAPLTSHLHALQQCGGCHPRDIQRRGDRGRREGKEVYETPP